jgi:hypothetical protein
LTKDAAARADGQFLVQWDNAAPLSAAQHHMTTALACSVKAQPLQNSDGLLPGNRWQA